MNPSRTITFPCLTTRLVPREQVVANNWNPNAVSADRMQLLARSIEDNGWCFPIVTVWDPDRELYVIVDGFHRWTIAGPEWFDLPEVPIVVLTHSLSQRMAATIQFNKARGHHQVDLDADLIRALLQQGLTDEEVAATLGMELDAVHRYKSLTGIAELFRNAEWSSAWEVVTDG